MSIHANARHERNSNGTEQIDTVTPLGFPGCGKGTVLAYLLEQMAARNRAAAHFEVGDMVRDHIRRGTEFGNRAKAAYPRLVPDGVIVPRIEEAVRALPQEAFWAVDGFPRSKEQVAAYERIMGELRRRDVILHLALSHDPREARDIAEERMVRRGEQATKKGLKPRAEDVDPSKRPERLDDAQKLYDVVAHFSARGTVLTVDASQDIGGVRGQVRSLLLERAQVLA